MKKILIYPVFFFAAITCFGQQDGIFSQYFFNPLLVNPGYAGSREMLTFVAAYKRQWVNMPNAPVIQTASLHGLINKDKIGLGLSLFNDQGGPVRFSGIISSYAYRVRFAKSALALGIQASLAQYHVNWNEITIEDQSDAAFGGNNDSRLFPDANFGVYYYSRRFYLGAATTHLLKSKLDLSGIRRDNITHLSRHYFITSGYVMAISNKVHFKPSVLMKYVEGAPFNVDLNANWLFYSRLWAGVGLRESKVSGKNEWDHQLLMIVEYHINRKFRVGYGYDMPLNGLQDYNSGSHEIMLGIDFNLNKTKEISPRYF